MAPSVMRAGKDHARRLPGDLDQSIFRIAAFAFVSLSTLALLTDTIGSEPRVFFPTVWIVTALAYSGGAISWWLAERRARIELILVLALLGIALVSLEASATGGVHSHVLVVYVVPVIFTAALLELRMTALVILVALAAAGGALLQEWSTAYLRSVVLLGGVMVLSAYVETRLLGTAVKEKAAAEHRALHDDLTGLPNRALFYRRAREAIRVMPEQRLAVLLLDVDHFKDINDTLGHHHGDLVLRELADRLQASVRPSDTVARLGGDEFGILLPAVPRGAGTIAVSRLLDAVQRPLALGGLEIQVQASLGVAVFPDHGHDVDTLVQRADVAMYEAKTAAGASHQVYAPERDPYSTERLELMSELRHAIPHAELVLGYQPQVDLHTRQTVGVEALVRWRHPRRGLLLPDKFVPLARHTGLMKALTREVLTMALRQCRTWHDAGLDLSVAVNVTESDLLDLQFPDQVDLLLAERAVDPSWLELEITEGTIMADPARARTVLTRLHAMGVRLSVDDFGTGYSSLAYLKELPVDAIKIDRSFVTDMRTNASDAVIVKAIIDLAGNLGLQVIAEGVEDEATWNQLAALGCDLAQGFHASPALPEQELRQWLSRWAERVGVPHEQSAGRRRLRLVG